jgi:Uma2 family endonuclease
MPPSGGGASSLAVEIATLLGNFVRPQRLGVITGAGGEFVLSQPDEPVTALAPDVAFVQVQRAPQRGSPEWDQPWHLAPDLAVEIAVEIASPHQYRPEMAARARRYLAAGVRLVWIVRPKQQQVDVWRPGADRPIATLGAGDALDGMDVLPGFTHPIADLFQ